jgi:hypothetical protein
MEKPPLKCEDSCAGPAVQWGTKLGVSLRLAQIESRELAFVSPFPILLGRGKSLAKQFPRQCPVLDTTGSVQEPILHCWRTAVSALGRHLGEERSTACIKRGLASGSHLGLRLIIKEIQFQPGGPDL